MKGRELHQRLRLRGDGLVVDRLVFAVIRQLAFLQFPVLGVVLHVVSVRCGAGSGQFVIVVSADRFGVVGKRAFFV